MFPDYTPNPEIPYGYCQCGCGKQTPLLNRNRYGLSKGQPAPLLKGHKIKRLEQRFWSKVDKSGGEDACWIWIAVRDPKRNYGHFNGGALGTLAHRVAYILTYGNFPKELYVCHRCDNPPCCNPAHLFLGTAQDNMDDMIEKGRDFHLKGEAHGMCKIPDEQLPLLRQLYDQGVSGAELGRIFNLSTKHALRLAKRELRI